MCPASANAAGYPARTGLHDLADLRPRELQRRPKPEQHARSQRHRDAEKKYGQVDTNHHLGGERRFGKQILHQSQSSVRSEHAQRRSNHREKERVSEQLTNDPEAARADSGSYRQFMLPRRAPRQQQNRDIPASDHQQQHHRPKEQIQCPAQGANHPVVQAHAREP